MTEIQEAALYKAFAAARADFAPIRRDATVQVRTRAGGTYTFRYATLDAILGATVPALSKHGLVVSHSFSGDECIAALLHCDGGRIETRLRLIVAEGAGPQEYGSALTYARRYSIAALLGVVADEDDDANIAEGNTAVQLETALLTPGAPNRGHGDEQLATATSTRAGTPIVGAIVRSVERKEGKKGPFWRIQMGNKWYTCFDSEIAAKLVPGNEAQVTVERHGNYEHITGLAAVSSPAPAGAQEGKNDEDIPF